MSEKLNQLKELLGEVSDLGKAASVLGWDQQVNMPIMGGEARGQQLATLSKIAQEKFTSDEVGKLLEDLKKEFAGADLNTDDAAVIRVAARNYDKSKRVPPEFVAEQAIVSSKAFEAWVEARAKSDFSIFRPHLEKVVELVQKYISFFPPADHPYDTLLDDYEPGMKTEDVKAIFNALRPKQVALIKAISSSKQVKDDFLFKKYNEAKLLSFGEQIITQFGYDWRRGRQDKAPHPFETTFSVNDVRITTRYEADNPLAMLFSTMHESGHAMYEQGINPAYERTSLAGGTSLAIHESQSRMWENLVGRSLPFWEHFFPRAQQVFPTALADVALADFHFAINDVRPSLIRVEADEATYNLHILIRFELEQVLLTGDLPVTDLPDAWRTKYRELLGIEPPDAASGVLQDIHWSAGLFGYFPTYSLGNLYAAQLFAAADRELGGLADLFRRGEFTPLRTWLREKIHAPGQRYSASELARRATGESLSHAALVSQLRTRLAPLYGL